MPHLYVAKASKIKVKDTIDFALVFLLETLNAFNVFI